LLFQELQEYLKDLEVWEHTIKDKQNKIASTPNTSLDKLRIEIVTHVIVRNTLPTPVGVGHQ
jgi:hypothetical protein